MNVPDLLPGIYLVGKHDGSVPERFYVFPEGAEVTANNPDQWWFRRMEVPTHMPSDLFFDSLPPMGRE